MTPFNHFPTAINASSLPESKSQQQQQHGH